MKKDNLGTGYISIPPHIGFVDQKKQLWHKQENFGKALPVLYF